MHCIVQFSWDTSFEVPPKDLSKFLEMISQFPVVTKDWDGSEPYYYRKEKTLPIVDLVDKPAEMFKRVKQEEQQAA